MTIFVNCLWPWLMESLGAHMLNQWATRLFGDPCPLLLSHSWPGCTELAMQIHPNISQISGSWRYPCAYLTILYTILNCAVWSFSKLFVFHYKGVMFCIYHVQLLPLRQWAICQANCCLDIIELNPWQSISSLHIVMVCTVFQNVTWLPFLILEPFWNV